MNEVTTILFPGSMVPFPQWMRTELRRRSGLKSGSFSGNYGMSYNSNSAYDIKYRGPQTSWMRMTSNAKVYVDNSWKEGFILYGGQGFDNAYGRQTSKGVFEQTIGYDTQNGKHILKCQDQPMRPPPTVDSINVTIRKQIYRVASIQWKCYSIEQLNYMANFFFTPYVTIALEWGWNNFNQNSLLDIYNVGTESKYDETNNVYVGGTGLLGSYTNPNLVEEKLKLSCGNYDAMIGHIINFGFNFDAANNCFNCTTEIGSNSKYYFGLHMPKQNLSSDGKEGEATQNSFQNYVDREFENDVLKKGYLNVGTSNKKVDGRYFVANDFGRVKLSDRGGKYSEKIYVTFDLFIDMLNGFVGSTLNGTPISKIDIDNVVIGAHKNMISICDDIIIPNSESPFIPSWEISRPSGVSPSKAVANSSKEIPMEKIPVTDYLREDKLFKSVIGAAEYRQNLNKLVNYNRTDQSNIDKYAFPTKTDDKKLDDKQKRYCGFLKNIYISTKLIKDAAQQQKLSDVLIYVCEKLNKEIPIWQLSPMPHPMHPNLITVVDERFTCIPQLQYTKNLYEINDKEPVIYFFDTFSQNSIITGFDFGVKMSNAVASMILNQVNSEIGGSSSETNDNTANQPTDMNLFQSITKSSNEDTNRVMDRLYSSPKIDVPKQLSDKDQDDLMRELNSRNNQDNLDRATLCFRKMINGQNEVVRFCLPDSKRFLAYALINEINPDPYYTSISTMPIPGANVTLTLQGISGFKTFQVFGVENLPEPYRDKVFFKIREIKHNINTEVGWTTSIIAAIVPSKSLAKFVK